jgi:hypothetical protein
MADRARAGSGRLAIDRQRSLAASAGAVTRQCCRHAFDVCKRGDDLLDALVGKVLVGTPTTSASNYWEDGPVRREIAPPAVSFYIAGARLTEMAVEAAIAYTNYPTRESASTGTRGDQGALKRLWQRITQVREHVAVGEVDAVSRQRTGGRGQAAPRSS